ncbi:MAG TPA: hypothetical protein VHF45_12970 [Thermoleophilaceae bacterium]|nr:hypothetical protein [Thermoleophilaceae bacterium]
MLASAAYAAPAGAATSFEGQCSIDGKSDFGKPLRFTPQEMDWTFTSHPGGGRCTGELNGDPVTNTPVDVFVDAHGPISCGVLGSSFDAPFTATFPADTTGENTITGTLSLAAVAAQNAVYVEGRNGGFAAGRASFFGQNDQVAVIQGCADGNTIRSLNVNVLIQTVGELRG